MKPTVSLRKALSDKKLLGAVLVGDSWLPWRVLLIASMGEVLTDEERVIFTKLTGRATEPLQRVEELCCVVGRRGGKSRAMATLACFIAGLCKHKLVLGEKGVCLCVAPDQVQSTIVLDYCHAAFEQSPILKQLIANRTADTLELTNGVSIVVRSASFRRLRGATYIAVLADEAAFWFSDEFYANTDAEILSSVRPGLATTGGPLIIGSSPYAKRGIVWDTFRRHHGPDGDPLIVVAKGTSRELNPSLPQSVVDRALERDPAKNRAEYLAEFRTDIETFVSFEAVQACVGDYVERGYISSYTYSAFCDPSGGIRDSYTLAVGHREGDTTIIDCLREWRPPIGGAPLSPEDVTEEAAAVCKLYKVFSVTGDRFGGQFPREQFRKRGINYKVTDKVKSVLYRDLLPALNSGRIVLPKNDRLVQQVCALERRVGRSGNDSISHPEGENYHDDLANAVAGCAVLVAELYRVRLVKPIFGIQTQFPDPPPRKPSKFDGAVEIVDEHGNRGTGWAVSR